MKSITSDSNAHFRRWLRLATQPRAVRSEMQTLAEGVHLAQAALAADALGAFVSAVIVRAAARGAAATAGAGKQAIALLVDRALGAGAAGYELAGPLYDRISPVEHGCGLLLVLDIAPAAWPEDFDADILFLDRIQDPGNAGTLLRTAAAAAIDTVVAAPGTAALWAPKVLRAAQGAHFRLRLFEDVACARLRAAFAGTLIGALAHDAPSLWSTTLPPGAIAWIFGAEGDGISDDARAACDFTVTIPVAAVESLNVAAAAAVCLFERQRRRAAATMATAQ